MTAKPKIRCSAVLRASQAPAACAPAPFPHALRRPPKSLSLRSASLRARFNVVHEASCTSHWPLPLYLRAQLRRSFTVRRLRPGSLGPQRRQIVFLGTTRLLRSGYRRVDSHTTADFLYAAFHRRQPLLAHSRTFPGGQRHEASRRRSQVQTQMTKSATPERCRKLAYAPNISAPATFPHGLRFCVIAADVRNSTFGRIRTFSRRLLPVRLAAYAAAVVTTLRRVICLRTHSPSRSSTVTTTRMMSSTVANLSHW